MRKYLSINLCSRVLPTRVVNALPRRLPQKAGQLQPFVSLQPATDRLLVSEILRSELALQVPFLPVDDTFRDNDEGGEQHREQPKAVYVQRDSEVTGAGCQIEWVAGIPERSRLNEAGRGSIRPEGCIRATKLTECQYRYRNAQRDKRPAQPLGHGPGQKRDWPKNVQAHPNQNGDQVDQRRQRDDIWMIR